ncbi:MAG: flagellin [Bryobacteraceae bacterium]|jgi:flagellin
MSLSIQTNVASLVAQNDLLTNTNFQNNTIQQLSSGYRINSAADDPAGLAAANQFRNSDAQLTQGIANANDGVSQLQIIDGGLTNVGNILNRLQTLATESASQTFTGNRATINNEYQNLLSEINRQAANIGLSSQAGGGGNNTKMSVYIGAGSNQLNSQVQIDLAGGANQVDAAGLSLANTNVSAGGTELTGGNAGQGNVINLNNTAGNFTGNQTFTFNIAGVANPVAVTTGGTGNAATSTVAGEITNLNGQLSAYGISASVAADGTLQFSGGVAFSVAADATANGLATISTTADYNAGMYAFDQVTMAGGAWAATGETEAITNSQGTYNLTLDTATTGATPTVATALLAMNKQLAGSGISAVANASNNGFTLQSASTFTINKTTADGGGGGAVFGTAAGIGAIALNNTTPNSSSSSADAAITAITNAVSQLGLVQGRVGAGENQLNYAISLATSQLTNFTSAESQIRDANVAQQAANLTKAQVLQQASIAAMAQANSAPQQYLALLKT